MPDAVPYGAVRVRVTRLPAGWSEEDFVAAEEPLEIRIDGEPVAVTMRTPGHDEELALGFCLSEGIPATAAAPPADLAANTIEVEAGSFDRSRVQRSFYTSSSCGVCGKGALEAVAVEAPRAESALRLPAALVASLPDRLREAQPTFAATGGLHATR
jgi:FdhD protein